MNTVYKMSDLRAVAGNFRHGNVIGGRTTKLVNVGTGEVMFEVIGVCPKGALHIAYCDEMCQRAGDKELPCSECGKPMSVGMSVSVVTCPQCTDQRYAVTEFSKEGVIS